MLRKLSILTVLAILALSSIQQISSEVNYDEMRTYYMVFLKSGKIKSQDSATAMQIQKAHLDNIEKLFNEGKLVLAGPFLDKSDVRGIFILAADTYEEALEMTNSDPAVKAGRLDVEIRPWYGPKYLMQCGR